MSSDDVPVGGYSSVTIYDASFPLGLDWEIPAASYSPYSDLDQAVLVGDYYAAQIGAWVEDPNAGWIGDPPENWYLYISLYQRSAASLDALSSADWTQIGINDTPYNGGAEAAFVEWVQITARYPLSDNDHRVFQWMIRADNVLTGDYDTAETNRIYFGTLVVPTPTPINTPIPPTATPTPVVWPTSTPTPGQPVFQEGWWVYLGGKWCLVKASS